MPKIKPLELLGTTLEGGGQLLRLSIGLSALTSKPLHMTQIRGGRSGGGGLKLQHLSAVNWLASATGAETVGAERGSKELEFWPDMGKTKEFGWKVDIGSPGAVSLVVQAILPYLLFAGGRYGEGVLRVRIVGGTNVSKSPSVEYVQHVLIPMLKKNGVDGVTLTVEKKGWAVGRTEMGSVLLEIQPLMPGSKLKAFSLSNRGKIRKVEAYVLAPKDLKDLFVKEISSRLDFLPDDAKVETHFEDSRNPKRLYVLLILISENGHRLGRDCLWDMKIKNPANAVGQLMKRVSNDIESEYSHGGCVDEYMRDQLVVFQALADGKSEVDAGQRTDGTKVEASLHALTAYWVAKQILNVDFDKEGNCTGCGMIAKGAITSDTDVNNITEGVAHMNV